MINPQQTSEILFLGIALILSIGVALRVFFRDANRGRFGTYACGLGFLIELAILSVGATAFWRGGEKSQDWIIGWVWPREELGALKLGLTVDSPSLTFCGYAFLLALLLFLFRRRSGAETLIGLAGVTLAWLSATPWLCLAGLGFCLLAGFISNASIRFIQERAFGLLLLAVGCAMLATDADSRIGVVAVCLGALFPALPLPFSSWREADGEGSELRANGAHFVLNLVFSVWALAALIYRMQASFESTGAGWILSLVLLGAAVYGVVVSYFQEEWTQAWFSWVGSLLLLGLAACLDVGFDVGAPILIFGTIGSVIVLFTRRHFGGNPYGVAAGGAIASGFIGFANAGTLWKWSGLTLAQPARTACVLAAVFVVFAWGFCLMFRAAVRTKAQAAGWQRPSALAALGLLSLGLVAEGNLSGGALFSMGDEVFHSPLLGFSGEGRLADLIASGNAPTAAALAWVVLAAALASGYGIYRKQASSSASRQRMPRIASFFLGAAGIPALFTRLGTAIFRLDGWFSGLHRLSLPFGGYAGRALESLGRIARGFDLRVSRLLAGAAAAATESPARATQRAHIGDVRWYLAFGIGIAALMLLHFAQGKT